MEFALGKRGLRSSGQPERAGSFAAGWGQGSERETGAGLIVFFGGSNEERKGRGEGVFEGRDRVRAAGRKEQPERGDGGGALH